MENATRALLMAAGVLVGMLIISLAVYLYYSLGGYVADRQEVIQANATAKFNEKFLKYTESNVTIQDIITVANMAYENNNQYNMPVIPDEAGPTDLYVRVNADFYDSSNKKKTILNLQNTVDSDGAKWLSTYAGAQKYKTQVLMSEETGRVYQVNFTKAD